MWDHRTESGNTQNATKTQPGSYRDDLDDNTRTRIRRISRKDKDGGPELRDERKNGGDEPCSLKTEYLLDILNN